MIEVHTLTDGGQQPMEIAQRIAAFLGEARTSLDLALYDVRLPSPVAEVVKGAITGAARARRRRAPRLQRRRPRRSRCRPRRAPSPHLLETLGMPLQRIPGIPDLMHHKYAVRDAESVWTGSTNWTADSWSREENVIVTVRSPDIAARLRAQLRGAVAHARRGEDRQGGAAARRRWAAPTVRAWFCPGQGEDLSHRIARAIGRARRVRIASPVITAGPIIGTLAQVISDRRADVCRRGGRHSDRAGARPVGAQRQLRRGSCRCSGAIFEPRRLLRQAAPRPTRPAASTTTCTPRSRWPTTTCSPAASTSRARAS